MLVEDVRSEGGYSEERFLYCVSRLLRRSEGEEEASAYFGRNDNSVACGRRRRTNVAYFGLNDPKESEIVEGNLAQIRSNNLFFVSGVEYGVGNDQARYGRAANDVGVDDFVHVLGLDASIPDCFGVNHHRWSQFTLVEASGFIGAHVFNSTLRQLGFE